MSAPTKNRRSFNLQGWLVPVLCLVLAAITFAVFGQTAGFEFVNFDDNIYVFENARVAGGLTLKGLVWVFTHVDCSLYHPLTMLSLMGDYQLHGLRAGGYHFTNVLLHTASVLLLFLILRQMTGSLWRSAFVAAVFAIHPLRVESVAWVAERKDVLSAFFFMLTLGAYVRYAENLKFQISNFKFYYIAALFLFAMALLSKPTVVTLPFVLLLLDYWPLRRFEQPGKLSRLILEKIPLVALSAGACVTTVLAAGGDITRPAHVSMPSRVGNALVYYMVYLRQMVWPEGLATPYPNPHNGLPPWEVALAGALLAGVSAVAWKERQKRPWLLIGWLWYLGMLTPMIGLVQAGTFAKADRYTYLPQIGIYMAVTWLATEWGAKLHVGRVAFGGLMTAVLALLMVCAWKQTTYWQNNEILCTHALACTANNYTAHFNFGSSLFQKGRVDDAITHYQKGLEINSNDAQAHYALGLILLQNGKVDDAITHYQHALQINPDYADVHSSLGSALLRRGKVEEAAAHFQKALQINPDSPQAHYNLANILLRKGRVDEAVAHYQRALQSHPDYAEAHVNLGNILLQKGRMDEAILHYQHALQIDPDCVPARINLGGILLQKGRAAEAIPQFQHALQLQPNNPEVQNSLAWLLAVSPEASLRDGGKAVKLAQRANELAGGRNPVVLRTLAAAFAEAGRFDDARRSAQKAIELAQAAGQQNLTGQLNVELKRYQAGLPLHQ